jgi:rhodanese-related sulfurtransferase
MVESGQCILVDVREPDEFALQRIAGAVNVPLSRFDPHALPKADGRPTVLQCGSGRRSAMAAERCQAAGVHVDTHLAGGIGAWALAGHPIAW